MTTFGLYLRLGFGHISDLAAYDHILFLLAITAVYSFREWKKVLILVTAFTIGHSLTLALATLKVVHISTDLIEFLIPVTIFAAGTWNVIQPSGRVRPGSHAFKYGTALFFGLIHGLGFSNYLRSLLGEESNLLMPLFSFNLGLEIGQIAVVMVILVLSLLSVDLAGVKRRDWNLLLSGAAIGVSLVLCFERWPWS
jgi:hypothetical protein